MKNTVSSNFEKMSQLQWQNARAETKANKALEKLDEVLQLKSDGSVSLGMGGHFDTSLGVLSDSLSFPGDLLDHEKRNVVRSSIIDCVKKNDLSRSTLQTEAHRRALSQLSKQKEPFVLLSGLSVRYFEGLATVRYAGAHLTFTRSVPSRFSRPERVVRGRDRSENLPRRFTVLRTHVRARDAQGAGETALLKADLIRSLWNLALNYGRRKLRFGSAKPMNDITWGPIHTLHEENGDPINKIYWWEPGWQKGIRPKNIKAKYDDIKEFESSARDSLKKVPFSDQLETILVRYVRSLDESDLTSSFLKLWSVLEDLTCTSNYKKTVRRGSYLFKDRTFKELELDHLRKWRNRIVHEGAETGDAEHFVNQLRHRVEALLIYLCNRPKQFQSLGEFGWFLGLPKDNTVLSRRLEQVKLAEELNK